MDNAASAQGGELRKYPGEYLRTGHWGDLDKAYDGVHPGTDLQPLDSVRSGCRQYFNPIDTRALLLACDAVLL